VKRAACPVERGAGPSSFHHLEPSMRRTGPVIAALLVCVVGLGVFVTARQDPGGGSERVLAWSGRALRDWDDRVAGMEREREMRLRAVQSDSLLPDRRHERLDQYYRGVRVVGGEVVRETDGQTTLSMTVSVYSGIRIDTAPALSPDDAVKVFVRETGATTPPRDAPELVILPQNDNTYVLAYRLMAFVDHQMPVVYVNARTGAVALRYNNLRFQQPTALVGSGVLASEGLVSGDQKKVSCAVQTGTYVAWDMVRPTTFKTYDLKGNLARAKNIFNGITPLAASDLASNSGSTWADSVVVDAHTYAGWAYDYFYKRHGWKGQNNSDSRALNIVVHSASRSDFSKYSADDQSTFYMNAFYCSACGAGREDLLMLGEGLPSSFTSAGQTVDYAAAALDIVAHEYTHGVTAYTSNLVYQNESGALDEAFSDIMSVGAEFYHQAAGTGLLKADYLEGEDAWRPRAAGSLSGLRSFIDPSSFGDPDHYSKRFIGPADEDHDYGGVHTNSSIVNHAFYLAVEGGTNRTSGQTVTGVGAANRDKVEKVFFRAFTTLTSNATFTLARAKTIQEARTLYGAGSTVETAVTQAWNAVGVF
jgi:bacillolysin